MAHLVPSYLKRGSAVKDTLLGTFNLLHITPGEEEGKKEEGGQNQRLREGRGETSIRSLDRSRDNPSYHPFFGPGGVKREERKKRGGPIAVP